jgi:iron(III) transport system permease protein
MTMFGRAKAEGIFWTWFLSLAIVGILALMLGYPLGLLFAKSFAVSWPGQPTVWGLGGWLAAFNDPGLPWALGNTFLLALARIIITTALAIFFAWVVTRTDTPLKGFIEVVLWLGFFLPLLPMTMGWILLLDPQYGLVNRFLMETLGLSSAPFNVFSFWGIVWCHLAFSTSIRFLLMTPPFLSMDAALEEAARTSGSNNLGVLFRISVPILAPALLASTALGIIKSLESFEIEMVLGIPAGIYVLSTKIWDFIHWEPPLYDRATALSSIFLMVIFALIYLHHVALRSREYTTVTGRSFAARPFSLGRWRWVTFGFSMLFIFIMILLPLAALIMGTFMELFGHFDMERAWTTRHWTGAFRDPLFLRSLMNTLILGMGAAVTGTIAYALVSYYIVRTRFPGRKIVDILSWLPWALPGVLISLAFLWVALGSGDFIKLLYGTIYLLSLAIIIKEMPLGTQIIKAGIMQISRELEEASMTSGAPWFFGFHRIVLPLLMPTLIAVGLIVFISAVRDIPTVIFLSTFRSRPLSLLMLDYIAEANMERAAVLGVFLVFLIFALLLIGKIAGMKRVLIES